MTKLTKQGKTAKPVPLHTLGEINRSHTPTLVGKLPTNGVQIARERQGISNIGNTHNRTVGKRVDLGRAVGVGTCGEEVASVFDTLDRACIALFNRAGNINGEGELVRDHRAEIVGDADHLTIERVTLARRAAKIAIRILKVDKTVVIDGIQATAVEA